MIVNYPQFGTIESTSYRASRVSSVAEELRALADQADRDVFDPFVFAQTIGIKVQLVELPAGCSGRLRTDKGYALIELNAAEIAVRRRFTLCHELAHICFWSAGPIIRERGQSPSTSKFALEEQLCDQIASELLVPTKAFVALAKKESASYNSIRWMARHFDVSSTAIIRKIATTKGHGWIAASTKWTHRCGSEIRRVGINIDSKPRTQTDRSSALLIARKAFETAEAMFVRSPYVLTSLKGGHVSLAMPSPEVTISRPYSPHQRDRLIRGLVFFRL